VVEHNLAKVGVASSNLVSRSNILKKKPRMLAAFLFYLLRLRSKVVMQWPAKPSTAVRFRSQPPFAKLKCGNSSVVEHNLAKVGVASSNLVSRSNILKKPRMLAAFLF
jgi:hypothetical protein